MSARAVPVLLSTFGLGALALAWNARENWRVAAAEAEVAALPPMPPVAPLPELHPKPPPPPDPWPRSNPLACLLEAGDGRLEVRQESGSCFGAPSLSLLVVERQGDKATFEAVGRLVGLKAEARRGSLSLERFVAIARAFGEALIPNEAFRASIKGGEQFCSSHPSTSLHLTWVCGPPGSPGQYFEIKDINGCWMPDGFDGKPPAPEPPGLVASRLLDKQLGTLGTSISDVYDALERKPQKRRGKP